MTFWEIISGMIAESWYPIHYFRLSFGKSDSLNESSICLQKQMHIPIDANKLELKKVIEQNIGNNRVKSLLRVFTKNVPYRFLSPWITYTYDADVVQKSQVFYNDCLYAIKDNAIEINPIWKDYLTEHYSILRDFAFWNLTLFLQKRNPNVPDVPSKLVKPIQRDSLTKQRKFWNTYICFRVTMIWIILFHGVLCHTIYYGIFFRLTRASIHRKATICPNWMFFCVLSLCNIGRH